MKHKRFHCGLVQFAVEPGALMNVETAAGLNFKRGDFLCIASKSRSTSIVREIKALQTPLHARPGYIYLDCESLDLLEVWVDAPLDAWASDLNLACP